MLSRIADGFSSLYFFATRPKERHSLKIADLVEYVSDQKASSIEKIARIKQEFKDAIDEVKFDNESNKYYIIRNQFYSGSSWDNFFIKLKGLAVNYEGRAGFTLLVASTISNDLDLIKWLIEDQDADINQGYLSPLMIAAEYGNIKIMHYLLSKGADINKQTSFWIGDSKEGNISAGSTALHRAIRFGQIDSVKFLTQNGASLLENKAHETAIELCEKILTAIDIIKSGKEDSSNSENIGDLFGFNDPLPFRDVSKIPSSENIKKILEILTQHYEKRISASPKV